MKSALTEELLVLADGHCLSTQALAACGAKHGAHGMGPGHPRGSLQGTLQGSMQAATLETLVNLVAAGYGSTLIPALAAGSLGQRGIVLLPLAGQVEQDDSAGKPTGVSPGAGSPGDRESHPEGSEFPSKFAIDSRLIEPVENSAETQ